MEAVDSVPESLEVLELPVFEWKANTFSQFRERKKKGIKTHWSAKAIEFLLLERVVLVFAIHWKHELERGIHHLCGGRSKKTGKKKQKDLKWLTWRAICLACLEGVFAWVFIQLIKSHPSNKEKSRTISSYYQNTKGREKHRWLVVDQILPINAWM